jgi:hypothetical protein
MRKHHEENPGNWESAMVNDEERELQTLLKERQGKEGEVFKKHQLKREG